MEEQEPQHWKAQEVARLLSLVETERRYYQEIVSALPIGLVILSPDMDILSSNREARKIFGLRSGEPLRGGLAQFVPAEVIERAQEVIETGKPVGDLSLEVPGDPERALRVNLRRIGNWNEENPQHESLLTIEVLEKRVAAREETTPRREPGVPAAELLENLDGLVWAVELPSKRFVYVNEKAQELLGHPVEKWLDTPTFWTDRIHPEDQAWVLAAYEDAIENWARHSCEFRAVSAYGQTVWLRESARLLADGDGIGRHLIGFGQDVTQRHLVESQFVQAQRMEAVTGFGARVAGEIAAQVNVLSGAVGAAERSAAVAKLKQLAGRLTSLQVRAGATELLEVTSLLEQWTAEMRAGLETGLGMEISLFPAPIGVKADREQLRYVVTVLVEQARRNLSSESGQISIDCSPMEIDEVLGRPGALWPGVYAVIRIEDDGPTMEAAARAALFESLLVPRDLSDLGPRLHNAESIVRQWGGAILAFPRPGRGNELQILLPRAGEAIEIRTPAPEVVSAPVDEDASSRPRTVLLMENDSSIRALMQKMLRRQGYEVIEAANADEALEASRENTRRIDLLIADLMMPEAGKTETMRRLREYSPDLKVLFLGQAEGQSGRADADGNTLRKPFTLGALVTKVKEVLAA